jgi:gliding motility-associated-like protein
VSNGTVSLPDVIVPLLTFASGDGTNDPSMVFTGAADAIAYALSGLRYTPNADYQGVETLSVGVTSSDDTNVRTTVPITVITNRLPTVSDLTVSTVENQPYVFRLADFTDQYEDPDDAPSFGPAQIYLTEAPQNGTFVYQGDSLRPADYASEGFVIPVAEVVAGALVYAPNAGFSGSDQARWNASDGAGQAESDAAILIEVLPALTIAVSEDLRTICSGQTDTLQVNITAGSAEGLTYAWSCPGDCGLEEPTNQDSVVVRPTQTTVYVVTVTNPVADESVSDTVTVVVEECLAPTLSIPNTFTPNGDETNDVWAISSQGGSFPLAVEVVDRYGHLVYRSEAYQGDWDGTYEGQILPEGTYYYLVTSAEGDVHKGPLTILR